jgi:hypothetical protein
MIEIVGLIRITYGVPAKERWTTPPKKGEKMGSTSKGNLLDFIKDASEKDSPQRAEFFNKLNMAGTTAENLLELFHGWNYDGVSLEDCTKLLNIVTTVGRFPCDFNQKY